MLPSARDIRFLYGSYFAFVGASSPFLPLLYAHWGLAALQIGLLASLSQVVRIALPPLWGLAADASGRLRALMVTSAVAMLAACLGLAQIPATAPQARFFWVAVAIAVLQAAGSGLVPLTESLAMRAAGDDAGRYGRMRVWGSIGFLCAVVATGPVLDRLGIGALVWVMAALLVLLIGATAAMPSRLPRPAARDGLALGRRLLQPVALQLMLSGLLMIVAHGPFYAFYSLYLGTLGYDLATIGGLWALGVVAEILLFLTQRRLFERVSASLLLVLSIATAALRFGLTAWAGALGGPAAFALLVLCQAMHAITFGLHHSASMRLLQRQFPDGQLAGATAVYLAATYGAGGAGGAVVAALVWDGWGAPATFAVGAGFACAGSAVALLAHRRLARGAVPEGGVHRDA